VVFIQLRSALEIQNSMVVVVRYHSHLRWARKKYSSGCRCLSVDISHYILTVCEFSLEAKYQFLRIHLSSPILCCFHFKCLNTKCGKEKMNVKQL